jgi:ketosteroid isomerase-like protein
MSQENVELVRQAFEAFNRDDRATVIRLLAPDVEWHTLAGPILGVGTLRGRDAMLKFWEDIAGSIEGFRARSEELTDLGTDRVLVVARFEGRGRSSEIEARYEGAAEAAKSRSTCKSRASTRFGTGWWLPSVTTAAGKTPSRPPGCLSSRCRRRTSRS